MRDFLEKKGDIVLTMVASSLLCVPIFGWLPLVGVAAAIGVAAYLTDNTRRK